MRRLVGVLANGVMVAGVLAALAVLLMPRITGARPVVVLSGSMEPTFPVGAVVLMERVDPATVVVGDVITFKSPGDPKIVVTHRVIEVKREPLPSGKGEPSLVFQTQGDAVPHPDPFTVSADKVVGRVRFGSAQLGYALHFIKQNVRTPLGFGLMMGLPSLLVVVGEGRSLMSLLSPGSRRAARRKKYAERFKKRWPQVARRLA